MWARFPDHDAADLEAFGELSDPHQTDRAVAILAAAFLEFRLEKALKERLPDIKGLPKCKKHKKDTNKIASLHDRLFKDPNAPLGTFASKIDAACALRLFGKNTYHDLDTIRQVRNAFAHERASLSFRTQKISQWCKKLRLPQRIKFGTDPLPTEARDCFLAAVNCVNWIVSEEAIREGRIETSWED